jgi:ABC-type transport system involved in cytochrome c biogenesis permease component
MIAMIALPLIIPLLLVAFKLPSDVEIISYFESWEMALQLLLAITIFAGVISVFATAKIVRIAAE